MAFQFPQNQDVLEKQRNYFTRIWLDFMDTVYRRLNGVSTLAQIVTPNVGAAPAVYSQAYQDQQTALINELKAQVNALSEALKK